MGPGRTSTAHGCPSRWEGCGWPETTTTTNKSTAHSNIHFFHFSVSFHFFIFSFFQFFHFSIFFHFSFFHVSFFSFFHLSFSHFFHFFDFFHLSFSFIRRSLCELFFSCGQFVGESLSHCQHFTNGQGLDKCWGCQLSLVGQRKVVIARWVFEG